MSYSVSSRFNFIELLNFFIYSYFLLIKLLWLLIDSSIFVVLVNGGCGGGGVNVLGYVLFWINFIKLFYKDIYKF